MTTDLDTRITRALSARADALTVTRPPLDDVVVAPGRSGGRRRTPLLVAAAVLVVLGVAVVAVAARPSGDDGVVDLRPTDDPTTTTTVPALGLSYLPADIPADPQELSSPDGRATVLTYGSGDRTLEVTILEATRSAELEDALDARATEAIVAAYAAGGSVPAAASIPSTPVAADLLGDPAALPDRPGIVMGDVQTGDDPLLIVIEAFPYHGQQIDVGLVAFRAGAEVRVAGHGIRLDEALAVLGGIDGPGLAPRTRPAEDPLTAAPLPAGTPFLRPVLTDIPEGWELTTVFGLGGGLGGEDVVVGGPSEGAALSQSGYGPVGAKPAPDAIFLPGPTLAIDLGPAEPLPEEQAALDAGDDAAIAEAFDVLDVGIWASGGERRVLHVDEVVLVLATGVVDQTTVQDLDRPHELTHAVAFIGPDLRLEINAEGVTDDQIVAALRSLVIVG